MVLCQGCRHWDKLPMRADEGTCKMAMEVYNEHAEGMRVTNNGCLVTKKHFWCKWGIEGDETNAEGT